MRVVGSDAMEVLLRVLVQVCFGLWQWLWLIQG